MGTRYLHLTAGSREWMVAADQVQHLRQLTVDAVIPGCPPFIPGLVAHEGRLIALVRLDALMKEKAVDACRCVVIVRHETDLMAIAAVEVAVRNLTTAIDPELGWDLPDEVALVAKGMAGAAVVLDVASLYRFVKSSSLKFWQESAAGAGTADQGQSG